MFYALFHLKCSSMYIRTFKYIKIVSFKKKLVTKIKFNIFHVACDKP